MTTRTVHPAVAGGTGAVRGTDLRRTASTALAPVVWGTTYIVTTEFLPPGHPMFAGLLRALPAGLIALAATRTLPRGAWWGKAAVLGGLNIGLFLPLLFTAAERLPGGVAATMSAAQPLLVALLAVAVLGERLSARRLAWGAVGVVGVGLVVIGPDAALDTTGIAAGLAGTAVMALGVTLTKRWGRPEGVGPLTFTAWQLTAGGLFLTPLTFLAEGAPPAIDGRAVLGYLWLGLVGGLSHRALLQQQPRQHHAELGALRALAERGVRVPHDVIVIGYSDHPYGAYLQPSLTSVSVPFGLIAEAAVSLLLRRIAGDRIPPVRRLLPAELIVRESSVRQLAEPAPAP